MERNRVASLEQALNNFYTEYDYLPDPRAVKSKADAVFDTTDASGVELVKILLGRETGEPKQNPKEMKFLDVQDAKSRKGGITYDKDGNPTGVFDAWGHGYRILIDYDGNGDLIAPADSGAPGVLHGRHAAVYSLGKDGKGGKEAIRSW